MAVEIGAAGASRPRTATYVGVGVITLSQLMYEIGLTRIFSVTMWYHFAFVAISLALFGMTVGALIVYLRPEAFPDHAVKDRLWRYSLLFAVSVPVSLAIQLRLPFEADWNLGGIGSILVTCLVISVPFVFGGIVVCLALTRFGDRVNRVYAADLVGAAAGCIGFVFLLRWFDGPSAVMAIGALGAISAFAFALDAGSRRGVAASFVCAGLIGSFAAGNSVLHDNNRAPVKIVYTKGQRDAKHQYEHWNNFSRITVDGDPHQPAIPAGWGMSTTLPADIHVNQLIMTIDSGAATPLTRYSGDPSDTRFLRYDITNLAHYARANANVLVVGVGGGRDILSALQFNQKSVTGVEMNGDILHVTNGVYGDFTGHLDHNPKVKMVNDEARSYLARTDKKYDIIQISLIDTWAATAAGAYALSENSLYTTDAFKVFFDRLKPGGVLSISRWYQVGDLPPLETYRTEALAAKALQNRGVANPRDHILIYHAPQNGFLVSAATLLISPSKFQKPEIATIDSQVQRLQFTPVLTPSYALNQRFAQLASRNGPGAAVKRFDQNVSPPTDKRPFFFQMADLHTFLSGRGFRNDLVTRPVLVLFVLGLAVIILALGLILVPLLVTTKRSAHFGMAPLYTYFAAIGLGFLLVEVSQLQRLSIFLGHPTYALTVVLFSLLLASGIGSMLSSRFSDYTRRRGPLVPMIGLLVVLVSYSAIQPRVISELSSATTPARITAATLMLMAIGLLMGMPFSIGMRAATDRFQSAPTAFLWGINGAASVCASVVGMVIAIFFGIAAAFWVGVVAYAAATVSLAIALRKSAPVPALDPTAAEPAEPPLPSVLGVPGA